MRPARTWMSDDIPAAKLSWEGGVHCQDSFIGFIMIVKKNTQLHSPGCLTVAERADGIVTNRNNAKNNNMIFSI